MGAARDLEAHLASCLGCRTFSEEMMVAERRLARLSEIEPRVNFTHIVMARIAVMPVPARPTIRVWWLGLYDLLAWVVLALLTAAGIVRWKAIVAESGVLFGKAALSANALYRVADHFHLTTLALVGGIVECAVLLFVLYAGRRYLAAKRTALFGAQTI
ncbi:MAG: hypothetical protein M3Z41_05440 [Candidatus Eremiobacteraeota bacterium]|nr:hypothetical protein [Candidatus Eremiobacteraeota bacterium]